MTKSLLTEDDQYLFNEGRFFKLYEKLGAHVLDDNAGVQFAVWAPNANYVSVVGDFNHWDSGAHPMTAVGASGVWAAIVPVAKHGDTYKYHISSHNQGYAVEKADPVGFCTETPPRTASVVWDLKFDWNDDAWMKEREARQQLDQPMSIYEVHLPSWRRKPEDHNRSLSYDELAVELVQYVKDTGYTHVEFMPVMEHPFGGSWGYQVTGYFAPTRRLGDPQGLMHLIDRLHEEGIGVILDWVPSHFPTDQHGLDFFDGTHLYEHADPRQGFHPDWKSNIFNLGRNEVRAFLIASAMFWLDKFHVDGLRVDGVASMLYLDYSRKEGEWIPNKHGGRENLESLQFLRELNTACYQFFPGVQMIAEESTSWPMISKPTYIGGVGFGYKWDMGWMHDTLKYFELDPVYRAYHHSDITFRSIYQFTENFVLSLSHDEVVYGKGSMIRKMAGDDWQKFANLRCLYGYMYAMPGKKLMFMGDEFAQWQEWGHDRSLDWDLFKFYPHQDIWRVVAHLNHLYKTEDALRFDCDPRGFEWVDGSDAVNSSLAFMRKDPEGNEFILCVFNFTPMPRENYQVGVPRDGFWQELFNSDASEYGGSGMGNYGGVGTTPLARHGHPFQLNLTLPPLGALMLKWTSKE